MSAETDAKTGFPGITLPAAAAPAANYVPYVGRGTMLLHLRPAADGGRQARA